MSSKWQYSAFPCFLAHLQWYCDQLSSEVKKTSLNFQLQSFSSISSLQTSTNVHQSSGSVVKVQFTRTRHLSFLVGLRTFPSKNLAAWLWGKPEWPGLSGCLRKRVIVLVFFTTIPGGLFDERGSGHVSVHQVVYFHMSGSDRRREFGPFKGNVENAVLMTCWYLENMCLTINRSHKPRPPAGLDEFSQSENTRAKSAGFREEPLLVILGRCCSEIIAALRVMQQSFSGGTRD